MGSDIYFTHAHTHTHTKTQANTHAIITYYDGDTHTHTHAHTILLSVLIFEVRISYLRKNMFLLRWTFFRALDRVSGYRIA